MKTKYILFLIILLFSGVFGFVDILPRFVAVGLSWILIIFGFKKAESRIYNKAFFVIAIGLIANVIACQIFRNQLVWDSFFALRNVWQLGLFFLFCSKKVKMQDLSWVLNSVGVLVAVLYLLQYVLFLFGIQLKEVDEEMLAKGADVRFRIACSGAIYLAFFRNLYDFVKFRKKSTACVVVVILTGTVALIMNFRAILLSMVICSIYLLYMMKLPIARLIKYVLVLGVIGAVFFSTDFAQQKIDMMTKRQIGVQNFQNDDYARLRSWRYYTEMHFINDFERVTGSGLPSAKSSYGKKMISLADDFGIYYADWGLIGYSWILGIISVLGMLYYSLIAYKAQKSLPYLKIWFLFMVLSSILTAEFMRVGNFMIQALVLAYIAKIRKYEIEHNQQFIAGT